MSLLKKYLFFIGIIILCACSDRQSSSRTILFNHTEFDIDIISYRDGLEDKNLITIPSFENVTLNNISPRGKTLEPSWGTLNQIYDSIIVVYKSNPIKKAIHLSWRDSTTICNNCLPYPNNRNISNEDNFIRIIEKNRRNYLIGYYEFTFTEDDYNFAKE